MFWSLVEVLVGQTGKQNDKQTFITLFDMLLEYSLFLQERKTIKTSDLKVLSICRLILLVEKFRHIKN